MHSSKEIKSFQQLLETSASEIQNAGAVRKKAQKGADTAGVRIFNDVLTEYDTPRLGEKTADSSSRRITANDDRNADSGSGQTTKIRIRKLEKSNVNATSAFSEQSAGAGMIERVQNLKTFAKVMVQNSAGQNKTTASDQQTTTRNAVKTNPADENANRKFAVRDRRLNQPDEATQQNQLTRMSGKSVILNAPNEKKLARRDESIPQVKQQTGDYVAVNSDVSAQSEARNLKPESSHNQRIIPTDQPLIQNNRAIKSERLISVVGFKPEPLQNPKRKEHSIALQNQQTDALPGKKRATPQALSGQEKKTQTLQSKNNNISQTELAPGFIIRKDVKPLIKTEADLQAPRNSLSLSFSARRKVAATDREIGHEKEAPLRLRKPAHQQMQMSPLKPDRITEPDTSDRRSAIKGAAGREQYPLRHPISKKEAASSGDEQLPHYRIVQVSEPEGNRSSAIYKTTGQSDLNKTEKPAIKSDVSGDSAVKSKHTVAAPNQETQNTAHFDRSPQIIIPLNAKMHFEADRADNRSLIASLSLNKAEVVLNEDQKTFRVKWTAFDVPEVSAEQNSLQAQDTENNLPEAKTADAPVSKAKFLMQEAANRTHITVEADAAGGGPSRKIAQTQSSLAATVLETITAGKEKNPSAGAGLNLENRNKSREAFSGNQDATSKPEKTIAPEKNPIELRSNNRNVREHILKLENSHSRPVERKSQVERSALNRSETGNPAEVVTEDARLKTNNQVGQPGEPVQSKSKTAFTVFQSNRDATSLPEKIAAETAAQVHKTIMNTDTASAARNKPVQLVIETSPLGRLEIQFKEDASSAELFVLVDNESARNEMEQLLPAIRSNMVERGIELTAIRIDLAGSRDFKEGSPESHSRNNKFFNQKQEENTNDLNASAVQQRNYGYNTIELIV